ncbi:MAG: hypothetical protein ABSH34_11775 [Verrucomicrobiota bacterium]|jgi:hypothetical protein
MSKLRNDSTWNQLTPEQRDTLEIWLFDDNLGYAETVERIRREFGLQATVSSVGRFRRRRAAERQAQDFADAQAAALELNVLPGNVTSLREAVVKLAAKTAFNLATEKPDDLRPAVPLIKLLLASEAIEIRHSRLKLAQTRLEHHVATAALQELPNLRTYLKALENDADLTGDEKLDRLRTFLYGWDSPEPGGADQVPSQQQPMDASANRPNSPKLA